MKLRGDSEASVTRARMLAAGSAEAFVRQLEAESKLRWNGQMPQFVVGGADSHPNMPVVLPIAPPAR